jgi:hypothetical protein
MSNALAIAGVTAVLRDLLDSGMIDHDVTDAMGQGVTVSAVAPDTIAIEGANARPQINIFLHQASHNAALRNQDLPSRDRGGARLSNPPLALDLHYLITAYGTGDLQAEVLLGYAMQLLHETPIPSRDAIRTALSPPGMPVDGALLPSVYQALRASDLAEQYEQIRITPAPMNTEEMSKLWSALQAHYRPTAAYQVSVALIAPSRPARAPLPVLTRGPREPSLTDPTVLRERGVVARVGLGPSYPVIEGITLPAARTAAHLADSITLTGHGLDGVEHALVLSLPRLGVERVVPVATSASATEVSFDLPNLPAELPAGSYLVTLRVRRNGEARARTSGQLMLQIAPELTSLQTPPEQFARAPDQSASLTLTCRPDVRPNQRASLLVAGREIVAEPLAVAGGSLDFVIPDAPVGVHHVRLRVDGVDSQLVDRNLSPPEFRDHRIDIT